MKLFPPSNDELLLALNAAPRISRAAACRLAQELSRWSESDEPADLLAGEIGIPKVQMERALAARANAAAIAAREREEADKLSARILLREDPGYPAGLAQLSLPPPVLYVAGEIPEGPALALVGSRRSDAYGTEVAETFARALAAAGAIIVSGFARGIDAAAHRGAMAAEGGKTVAVLGCGLGVDYPAGHARLGQEIAGRGALVTELPCGTPPRAWHFPIRNRIIAALSAGVLVVQATPRSGSLITVRHALDLGKEVYAVPGRIFDERSLGPHALLREGAKLAQHPQDLLDDLLPRTPGPLFANPAPVRPDPPMGLAGEIFAVLAPGSFQVPEDLAVRVGQSVDQVLGALLELELGGWVKRKPGPVYGVA